MQGKLSQRILLNFYKTKLKTLNKLSPELAARSAFELFCTPGPAKKMEEPPVFHKSEKISLLFDKNKLQGYHWRSSNAGARKVLICHGFQSRAFKFEKYVRLLLQAGFEVIAFDAPAHGLSEGKRINAFLYSRIILAVEEKWGPLYALICHSLGGLAAGFAFEELNHTNKKLVLIAPAIETSTAVRQFFQLFPLTEAAQQAFKEIIFDIRQHEIAWYSLNRAMQNISCPVLWIHDTGDRQCLYDDTLPSRMAKYKNLQFVTTEKLGHNKIYRDSAVQQYVMEFLSS